MWDEDDIVLVVGWGARDVDLRRSTKVCEESEACITGEIFEEGLGDEVMVAWRLLVVRDRKVKA